MLKSSLCKIKLPLVRYFLWKTIMETSFGILAKTLKW